MANSYDQTQFYTSAIKIGSTIWPVYPGATLTCPKNWAVNPIVGNYWAWNVGDGLQMPVLEVRMVVLDTATSVLSATNLNNWLARSADVAHDTTDLGNITLFDGRSTVTMSNCKMDGFTISTSKGEEINATFRFVGCGLTTTYHQETQLSNYRPTWSQSNVLRFSAVRFLSPSNDAPWGFGMNFSHGHTPNLNLNGTDFPSAQNAGMMAAGITMTVQAASDNAAGGPPITDSTGVIQFRIGGTFTRNGSSYTSQFSTTFTLNQCLNNTPNDRQINIPRNMRQYNYIALGNDAYTTPPLVVS